MNPFPSPQAAAVVDEIAGARALLAFDFDGTLAPIVEDRTRAAMRAETRALLRATALLYPCAVISGRRRADVAARVNGVPLVAVVGCHGAEAGFGPLDRAIEARVASWRPELERALAGADGIELEDKRFGIALHYRRARSWPEAERRALSAAAALEGAVVFGGNAVVNVVPRDAPTKGDAIRAACERLGARVAVYVGDDRTDEEAFRADVVSVSIRVGAERDSAAAYALPDQRGVDDLLRALLDARTRRDGRGERWEGLARLMARGAR
jgi:trehalose 6-phosphate phosphatase